MKRLLFILITVCFSFAGKAQTSDYQLIQKLIANYKISINNADTILAAKIWVNTPEVSFIHPRGHEKGWPDVKKNFYGVFRERFQFRDLKSKDESINIYGETAWVEFYWVFYATFKNGDSLQTKGRETQILQKIDGQWRIVHIHYSNMPVTGERQGF